jgi:hypothetical protein
MFLFSAGPPKSYKKSLNLSSKMRKSQLFIPLCGGELLLPVSFINKEKYLDKFETKLNKNLYFE